MYNHYMDDGRYADYYEKVAMLFDNDFGEFPRPRLQHLPLEQAPRSRKEALMAFRQAEQFGLYEMVQNCRD